MTRYSTVKDISENTDGAITEKSARWLIFNNTNGFRQCVRKIGKKILINMDQMYKWIEEQKGETK